MKQTTIYDCALIERPIGSALEMGEIVDLLCIMDMNAELIPIEIDSLYGDSSAMGFISIEGFDRLNDPSEFHEQIGSILSDMSLENEDGIYELMGNKVYLNRNKPSLMLDFEEGVVA